MNPCGSDHNIACSEVLEVMVLFIDQELEPTSVASVDLHLAECSPCQSEVVTEKENLTLLKELLSKACHEEAPASLHEKLLTQTQALSAQMQAGFFAQNLTNLNIGTQITTSFTRTEITIDGQRTIEIEHTQEFRHDF